MYLEGSKFEVQILTDHKNLIYFTTTKELNRRQVRWWETLSRYNFRISYVKGADNARADALSRKPEYQLDKPAGESHAILAKDGDSLVFRKGQLAATSVVACSPFEEQIRKGYEGDPVVRQQEQSLGPGFSRNPEGILMFQGRTYIPSRIRASFVREQHELPAHGHQGIAKTLSRISRDYYFPGMRQVVKDVVLGCDTCIRSKSSRHAPYGLMKSPATPPAPWKSIALDFVVKLPLSKEPWTQVEYDSILVITDRLTKYAYMLPYRESSSAEDLAHVFIRTIFAQHGTPDEIISDRDKLFTSKFWKTLMTRLGLKQKMSTAFHPQTDSATERINQTMETYLRCYVNYKQTDWVEWLPIAQFAYNSADSETTKVSPFHANFGYNPTAYGTPMADGIMSQGAITRVDELKLLHEELATDINFLAQRSAIYYNKHRSVEPTLKEGDKVWLIRKNIKTKRPSDKLDHKKLGPFKIDKVVGPVNYRLKLPRTMNIHPVFHISLLEPALPGSAAAPNTEIDPVNPDEVYDVEKILDCKMIRKKMHYLVKWLDYPHSENSWEPLKELRSCSAMLAEFHRQNPGLPRTDQKSRRRPVGRPRPG